MVARLVVAITLRSYSSTWRIMRCSGDRHSCPFNGFNRCAVPFSVDPSRHPHGSCTMSVQVALLFGLFRMSIPDNGRSKTNAAEVAGNGGFKEQLLVNGH